MKKIFFLGLLLPLNALFAQTVHYTSQTSKNNPPDVHAGEKIVEKMRKLNQNSGGIYLSVFYDTNQNVYVYSGTAFNTNYFFITPPPTKPEYKDEAFAIYGAISDAYFSLEVKNKSQIMGYPISDEFRTPNKNGAGQHFQFGSIYWSEPTGAHEIHGAIKDKWASMGWENSFLGFPVTDETATPDGYGRFSFFENGAIYFHPHLGTFAIPRLIADVWKKEGWEKGKLGYPISDEIIKNNNSVQLFEFGAIISNKAGAYKVIFNSLRSQNGLYTKWKQTGGVDSYLGDLVTANKNYPKMFKHFFAEFQNGFIYEDGTTAFVIKKGPIFEYYAKQGWETGKIGLPIQDEKVAKDGTVYQNFQGGTIFYTQALGAFEKKL
jgi:uncharacterized protein with LGFP repeats